MDYIVNYFDRDTLVRADSEEEARRKGAEVLRPRRPALLVVRPRSRRQATVSTLAAPEAERKTA